MKHSIKGLLAGVALAVLATPALTTAAFARDITVDLAGEPSSLDPHMQWNPDSYYVYRNIFDNLVTRNNEGDIVAQVASDWQQVSDTEMTFTIRDGITFHDGAPLTANDVLYSVKRIIDPEFGSPQLGQFNQIIDATAEGNVVTLTTDGPYPALLAQLVKLSIVPQHVVEEVGADAFNNAPVGSGPYAFSNWNRGVSVTLTRNEDYWGEAGPFEAAIFRAVPDAATRVADLQAGNADLVVSIDSDAAMQLQSNPDLQVLSAPTERVAFLGLNLDVPPFNDPDMRRAASLAIDIEGITQGLLGAGEMPMAQLSSPAHFGYAEGIMPFEYDPDAAREITSANPDLAATPATFGTAPVFDQRIVQALQQMLNDVGFDIEISITDMPTYLASARNPDRPERPELSFGRWSCACQDADGIAYPLLHSSSSWSRVNVPELDELLQTARVSLDEAVRQEAYARVHEIVRENYYVLPLYQAAVLYGASDDIAFEPTANESMFLNRMSISE
ncbi:peptide/nickel transport system substrate-binding protein [Jannaschia faecimaris]|uniref:Peptide/nickel transport system substrate-binding protein n=1 Tax=Jannaschia faecimaris TaxID=1244108 RepID=A0A1H3P6P8_9RHOB|nr:ABC transporter substrate-binding protein [Jannaschia faecimaris]SDY96777.1 peptide/nickel transport system substrate-binding protein [Jannaschia faecimaris]